MNTIMCREMPHGRYTMPKGYSVFAGKMKKKCENKEFIFVDNVIIYYSTKQYQSHSIH